MVVRELVAEVVPPCALVEADPDAAGDVTVGFVGTTGQSLGSRRTAAAAKPANRSNTPAAIPRIGPLLRLAGAGFGVYLELVRSNPQAPQNRSSAAASGAPHLGHCMAAPRTLFRGEASSRTGHTIRLKATPAGKRPRFKPVGAGATAHSLAAPSARRVHGLPYRGLPLGDSRFPREKPAWSADASRGGGRRRCSLVTLAASSPRGTHVVLRTLWESVGSGIRPLPWVRSSHDSESCTISFVSNAAAGAEERPCSWVPTSTASSGTRPNRTVAPVRPARRCRRFPTSCVGPRGRCGACWWRVCGWVGGLGVSLLWRTAATECEVLRPVRNPGRPRRSCGIDRVATW